MPRIIVNEYDKSGLRLNEYSNFSVVIPGVCGAVDPEIAEEREKMFKENNDVYECSDAKEFKRLIGLADAISDAGVAPVVDDSFNHRRITTRESFDNLKAELYTREANSARDIGYLRNEQYKYTFAGNSEWSDKYLY